MAELEVVFRDDWLAVIDKPAGLVVHPAPGTHEPTMVELLGEVLGGGPDPARPGIVHRLDRDTSGLMIVARTDEAHRRLSARIAAHEVEREYLALVSGKPRSRRGTIDAPLGRDFRAPERRAVGGRGAKQARTHFEVAEALGDWTLLRLRLETGRTHQIRAHLTAIGLPVAGDSRYGGRRVEGLGRQFLHSARLRFDHPADERRIEFESALPAELEAALERVRNANTKPSGS